MESNVRTRRGGRAGVTLPEMLVAVSITVLMLAVAGMVFSSSSRASGKATALNELMRQARAITQQLERDFHTLRPDLPMAIIFETDDPTDLTSPRLDRMVFFTNGDFQTPDGAYSGNLARIFYGQSEDAYQTPAHLEDSTLSPRRILTRRYKILHVDGLPPVHDISMTTAWSGYTAEGFDAELLERSTESYWKRRDATLTSDFLNYHFRTDPAAIFSMVRRSHFTNIQSAVDAGAVRTDALQQLYLLPDVSEFRIDAWYETSREWGGITSSPTCIYWNVPDIDGALMSPQTIDGYDWFSEEDIAHFISMRNSIPLTQVNMWPKALRFTFTLHDPQRRHFPEGKAFSYIVELPPR